MNTLLHKVEVEDRATVESSAALASALNSFGDLDLDSTYCVELLAETLSDGSVARTIRIREAQPA